MRRLFFLVTIALLQCSLTNAQTPSGGKMPEFKAKNTIGLVTYDADEVCDEAKVKDEEKRQLVTKAIAEYNYDIKQFNFQHALKLSDIDLMVNSKQKEAMESQNIELLRETQLKTKELIAPYQNLIDEASTKLDEKLKKVLSDKEFKRWSKYSEKKKEDLLPKSPAKTGNSGMQQQQRMPGMQRGGYGNQRRY
jgi:hypothetical protein